ncbi:MAG: hypothetical protein OQK73_10650 [Gammaproteobacteria bacterium]|nr:hypothetical protein [Gammaproteobacteria bacterium]
MDEMRVTLILLMTMLWSGLPVAEELHLILNGKAYHFDRNKNYNEDNWGLGFEYDLEPQGKWIPLITGSRFKDSNDQNSNYLGGGAKHRFSFGNSSSELHFDVGLVAFLMTRKDYNGYDPFLGALPFVSLGNDHVAVNATYIPSISPKHTSLLYFQLAIKLLEF